jgi:hypothetical protein
MLRLFRELTKGVTEDQDSTPKFMMSAFVEKNHMIQRYIFYFNDEKDEKNMKVCYTVLCRSGSFNLI